MPSMKIVVPFDIQLPNWARKAMHGAGKEDCLYLSACDRNRQQHINGLSNPGGWTGNTHGGDQQVGVNGGGKTGLESRGDQKSGSIFCPLVHFANFCWEMNLIQVFFITLIQIFVCCCDICDFFCR